jgi:hypothetical protein
MTYDEKIAHLMEDLKAHGLDPKQANPPFYRILHTIGILTKPPHFQPTWVNALCLMVPFMVIVTPLAIMIILAVLFFCGVLHWIAPVMFVVGSAKALWQFWGWAEEYEEQARKLKLPAWEDYPAVHSPREEALPEPTPNAIEPEIG